jgi:hypothetical protein
MSTVIAGGSAVFTGLLGLIVVSEPEEVIVPKDNKEDVGLLKRLLIRYGQGFKIIFTTKAAVFVLLGLILRFWEEASVGAF